MDSTVVAPIVVFIIYILMCLAVSAYAINRDKSGIAFFIISLLVSPAIGFVVLLLISPLGKLKKCERCGELVKIDAKRCRYCGNENVFFVK